ncbi:MAG: polyphosphate kinase 1 [Acidobacteriota bacterium]|nr:polyphosphate kinase 1 [Acidobacteriota bacterium]
MALDPKAFLNREMSWLAFNRRVLEEALDPSLPPLERLKFLAITGSNLDEFFMVRVGGLRQLVEQGRNKPDVSGLKPSAQLKEIRRMTRALIADQYGCLEDLESRLAESGIRRVREEELTDKQESFLRKVFQSEILPVLTPIGLSPDRTFPAPAGLRINVLIRFRRSGAQDRAPAAAMVTLPKALPRFVTLPLEGGWDYILLEDVVRRFSGGLFPGEIILECLPFRITRNADLAVREDQAADLLEEMKEVLVERKLGSVVRLEVAAGASRAALDLLKALLDVPSEWVDAVPGPLDLSANMHPAGMTGFEDLKIETWIPQPVPDFEKGGSVFDVVGRKDVLLSHPYESFDPVRRLVEEAADDPNVLAVKQILYRTSENSPITAALVRAAENEKHVTVLVELKARFDEARNIVRAVELEQAGAQVIYGVRGLKTHAKICIVVRREPSGIRRYIHFGTGNYNEKTAALYSDIGYMTCREEYARDAAAFFNMVAGLSQPVPMDKIEAAPLGLKARLIELIENEAERQRQGQKGLIRAKMNSLSDPEIIEALCRASQAGVEILLNVRGICCLRPGVRGLSETVRVISIVDRFLEHSRIVHFRNGGEDRLFISSADWMPRNLDRRIELLVAVEDPACRRRLLSILDVTFQDNVKARELRSDGSYVRVRPEGKKKAVRSQAVFARQAREAAKKAAADRAGEFVPIRPASGD